MREQRSDVPQVGTGDALGQSEVFLEFQERLSRVAKVDRPVLLIGERGTGKELAASRIHYLSKRWEAPLVALNAAALPASLIESELFGHEAGAFTGAVKRRAGRFERANGGTLFLDEIGSIPMETQEKILRVVEYGTFERVGGQKPIEADVRIIGATNANLADLADRGEFKQDLLDRLSFEVLFVPPLREREGDVLLLANHFAARMSHELGRDEIPEFTDAAMERLEGYLWPGNVRELKNVIERAVYRADSSVIDDIIFDPFESPYAPPEEEAEEAEAEEAAVEEKPEKRRARKEPPADFTGAVRELEVQLLRDALEKGRHNQKKAAELLGLTYHQWRGLYRKYREEIEGE